MIVSTKGRYGLRLLLDIALHQESGAVNLNDIAGRQRISSKYLWQVINPLKAGGIVRVTRGARGGYVLARPAGQITLCDALDLLEGPMLMPECADEQSEREHVAGPITRELLSELTAMIRNSLSEFTLADIVERARVRLAGNESNFVI